MRTIRLHLPAESIDGSLTSGRQVALPESVAQHVTRVLRLRAGAAVVVFDGTGGEWSAQLVMGGRDRLLIEIGTHQAIERESPLSLTLWQGLARGERMDLVIQKATELGVTRIVPLATARSVVQLDAVRGEKRLSHWRAIAASACEQCGRNRLPEIVPPRDLPAALADILTGTQEPRWLLEPSADRSLGEALAEQRRLEQATVLIGPEGGFDDEEMGAAARAGFEPVRFGPRVLRTETAGLAVLAALQSRAGDLA